MPRGLSLALRRYLIPLLQQGLIAEGSDSLAQVRLIREPASHVGAALVQAWLRVLQIATTRLECPLLVEAGHLDSRSPLTHTI